MDRATIETLAVETYERVKLDPERPSSPLRIARLMLGEDAVTRPPSMLGSPAALVRVHGKYRIALKRSVPIEYARFFAGHELGHLILESAGYADEDIELACDYFGAALIAPRPAERVLYRTFGLDIPSMAKTVGATQTWAALRIGEVQRIPLAVVAPTLRVRGPEDWVWGPEQEVRRWSNTRRLPHGLTRIRLTDDTKRVVLIADESATESRTCEDEGSPGASHRPCTQR